MATRRNPKCEGPAATHLGKLGERGKEGGAGLSPETFLDAQRKLDGKRGPSRPRLETAASSAFRSVSE